MGRERLEPEFGVYSEWLADAVSRLGPDRAIPAACRGTGNPALLQRMADAIGARDGMLVLDLGCGLGGPAAWLERNRGCGVVAIDVMESQLHAMRRLFRGPLPVAATGRRLPFGDGAFDGAWALGTLETMADKATAVEEVARVLAPEARFAVYSYACRSAIADAPRAGRFVDPQTMRAALCRSGLRLVVAAPAVLPPPPVEWLAALVEVRADVQRTHRSDPLAAEVDREVAKIRRLVSSDAIEAWFYVLAREGD